MNERDIFIAALEKQTDAERVAVLDEACGGNGELRAGVEALLREHARLDSFLESPAPLFVDCGDEDGGGQPQDDGPRIAVPGLETGVLGDFRILREIGRGGMGVVYEAEQISLGRRLALKVLPFAAMLDPRQLQRFQNEARAAASLKHPNIVQVYAVGCERGVHYFAMEYVEGRTLSEVLRGWQQEAGLRPEREKKPTVGPDEEAHQHETAGSPTALSTKDTRRGMEAFRTIALWGVQAAEALEHAHQMGVVHRDIKSANLMVDARGHLWITDFGLAMTQQDPAVTKTGDIIGTLRYMSPEQALGKGHQLDHRDRHLFAGRHAVRVADAAAGLSRERPRAAHAPAA